MNKLPKSKITMDQTKAHLLSSKIGLNQVPNINLSKEQRPKENSQPLINAEVTKVSFTDDIGNAATEISFMPKESKMTVGYTIQVENKQSNIAKSKSTSGFNGNKDRVLIGK